MPTLQEHTIERPSSGEYAPYYGKYIDLVTEADAREALQSQVDDVIPFLRSIPESQAGIVHPPYAWTIKQVISHLIDGERIFAYRALRFARGDSIALPGFDEGEYAQTAMADRLKIGDLVSEFESVRRATLTMLANFPDEAWTRKGVANDNPISVRALAWAIAGHVRHHINIVRKRLGKS